MRNIPQKKRKSDTKFVIASAGREGTTGKSIALHANLSEINSKESIQEHYNKLIANGLDAAKVSLVVTDMLPAYDEVIADTFPNKLPQYCTFHFIQAFAKCFKKSLKIHRNANYEKGERKETHKTSFLMLKGQEKLTAEEQKKVQNFAKSTQLWVQNMPLKRI